MVAQSVEMGWEEAAQDRAFGALKAYKLIACPPVIRLPDFSKEFVLKLLLVIMVLVVYCSKKRMELNIMWRLPAKRYHHANVIIQP